MLIGTKPLYLPPYDGHTPTECRVRCPECKARYFVFTGARIFGRVREGAKEKAEKMGAKFIDSLETPLMECECGCSLDFTICEVAEMVM
jgi:hypothetical protein